MIIGSSLGGAYLESESPALALPAPPPGEVLGEAARARTQVAKVQQVRRLALQQGHSSSGTSSGTTSRGRHFTVIHSHLGVCNNNIHMDTRWTQPCQLVLRHNNACKCETSVNLPKIFAL